MPGIGPGRALGVLLLGLVTLSAGPARAQTAAPPQTVIVIADINQIMRDAKSAKDVQAQIDKAMANFSREVSNNENELQQMRDKLERERNTLSPNAYSTMAHDYQRRFDALDRRVQTRRQALQQSYNDAMTKIENTALQIIAQIANERKANMVLTRAAVLFAAKNLDITAEVTKRLDAKLPSMMVKLPPPPPPPSPPPKPH